MPTLTQSELSEVIQYKGSKVHFEQIPFKVDYGRKVIREGITIEFRLKEYDPSPHGIRFLTEAQFDHLKKNPNEDNIFEIFVPQGALMEVKRSIFVSQKIGKDCIGYQKWDLSKLAKWHSLRNDESFFNFKVNAIKKLATEVGYKDPQISLTEDMLGKDYLCLYQEIPNEDRLDTRFKLLRKDLNKMIKLIYEVHFSKKNKS